MRPTAAYFCYSNCLWQAHFILCLWVENPLIPGPLLFSLPSWWLPPILCVCVCFPFSFPPRKGYQVPSFGLYFPWICSPPVLCSAVSHFVSQALVSAGFWQTPGLWSQRKKESTWFFPLLHYLGHHLSHSPYLFYGSSSCQVAGILLSDWWL